MHPKAPKAHPHPKNNKNPKIYANPKNHPKNECTVCTVSVVQSKLVVALGWLLIFLAPPRESVNSQEVVGPRSSLGGPGLLDAWLSQS